MAVLEHQGWAVVALSVTQESRVVLRCAGVTAAFLHVAGAANSTAALLQFGGDIYSSGAVATQFDLPAGSAHRVFAFIRAKVSAQITCSAEGVAAKRPSWGGVGSVISSVFGGDNDRVGGGDVALSVAAVLSAPDVLFDKHDKGASRAVRKTPGVLLGGVLGLLVTARHGDSGDAVVGLHCIVEGDAALASEQPAPRGLRINAGSGALVLPCSIELPAGARACPRGAASGVKISVRVHGCAQRRGVDGPCTLVSSEPREHVLRCRGADQSATMTFIDHDGSAAAASIVLPIPAPGRRRPTGNGTTSAPVLLTLHGTGVTGGGQADAYKQMPPGSDAYEFGVAGAWVLAPDRFGAHNWQGWGLHSAFAALQALQALTHSSAALPAADVSRVLFAGHSMGGAGAWFAATAAPDLAIAAAPAAGWLVKVCSPSVT